jgi:hypothetical protein
MFLKTLISSFEVSESAKYYFGFQLRLQKNKLMYFL